MSQKIKPNQANVLENSNRTEGYAYKLNEGLNKFKESNSNLEKSTKQLEESIKQ